MARDPKDRYATAAELADELKQFQTGRLVRSHSYSTWQLVRRWARLHAGLLAVAGASVLLLAGGGLIGVRRILAERERANREAANSRRAVDFLTGMFKLADPSAARGSTVTAREILDTAARQIGSSPSEDSALQARLMQSLGAVYTNLGLYLQAQPMLESSQRTLAQRLGPDHPDALMAAFELARVLEKQMKLSDAEKVALELATRAHAVLGESDSISLRAQDQLGLIYLRQRRFEESGKVVRDALQTARRVRGAEDPLTLSLISRLARVLEETEHEEDAEKLLFELVETRRRIDGPDALETRAAINSLASVYQSEGRFDEAATLFRQNLEVHRRVLGPDHPDTVTSLENLAWVLYDQKRYADAEPLLREAIARQSARHGPDDPRTLGAMIELGHLLVDTSRLDEAEKLLQKGLAGLRRSRDPSPARTAFALEGLARVAMSHGEKERAVSLLGEMLDQGSVPAVQIQASKDPLFAPLRGNARFEAVVAAAKSHVDAGPDGNVR